MDKCVQLSDPIAVLGTPTAQYSSAPQDTSLADSLKACNTTHETAAQLNAHDKAAQLNGRDTDRMFACVHGSDAADVAAPSGAASWSERHGALLNGERMRAMVVDRMVVTVIVRLRLLLLLLVEDQCMRMGVAVILPLLLLLLLLLLLVEDQSMRI